MLFNTNENSLSQQVILNKNNIDANTKAIDALGELDTEAIAKLTEDVVSLKTTTTKNTDEIEFNKSNISQNSTDIEVNKSNIFQNSELIIGVRRTADDALIRTYYDEFVTTVTSSSDYVSIPDITRYDRIEIQYAGRISNTGDYAYLTNSVVQMSSETTENFQPFTSLVWSSSTWAHIGGYLTIPNNRFYPLMNLISRGNDSSSTYISYGVKVTIRCYNR